MVNNKEKIEKSLVRIKKDLSILKGLKLQDDMTKLLIEESEKLIKNLNDDLKKIK